MEKSDIKYFLGANSAEGFVSVFKECYNPLDGWKAYIIKGGPGTGKSSFMKLLVKKAADNSIKTQLFPCSSDPDSLDAVIFPDIKTAVMDGTAPHTVDPDFPGMCDSILNFGAFWNEEKLISSTDEIIAATKENKALHKSASGYIKAAGRLFEENYNTALRFTDTKKTAAFAEKLSKKYIPAKFENGYEWVRFLSGVTPKGVISFTDTVLAECENTVIIADEYGAAANEILKRIRESGFEKGYEIITVKNALLPSLLLDAVIIPELSLGFVREYSLLSFDSDMRRIRAERFTDTAASASHRRRLKFNSKTAAELLKQASDTLSMAKSVHDELEKPYISAMDFNALGEFAEEFAEKLF